MEDNNKINREIVIMVIMVIILILSLLGILLYEVYKNKGNNINNNVTRNTVTTTKLNSVNLIHNYLDKLVSEGTIIDYNIIDNKSVLKDSVCGDKIYSSDSMFYSVIIEYKKSDVDYSFGNSDTLVNDNIFRARTIFVIDNNSVLDVIEQC